MNNQAASTECKLPNCHKKRHAKGYCGEHYNRWRRWGDPEFRVKAANGANKGCKIPGCEGKHKGHGYCEPHYMRLRRYGRLTDEWGWIHILENRGRPRTAELRG